MELKDVVMKLVGPVDPVGESREDERRLENLKVLCELTNNLVAAIDHVGYYNKDRVESSMKTAGIYASNYLTKHIGITE